ncbi:MAG: hypothetical protein M0031_09985 [Thermaerobacter sp.]|nr:hypothetical protein [Thermaerobacter sp.]
MAVKLPTLARDPALRRLADTVLDIDPTVRDLTLIGSVVYAPDIARDYDLVVTTNSQRDHDTLWQDLFVALNEKSNRTVDLVLRRPGERIRGLARAITAGRALWGGGGTIAEASQFFQEGGGIVSSFVEAMSWLKGAEHRIQSAIAVDDANLKDIEYKQAFDALFQAARVAALTYLGWDQTNWGGVAHELPWPYNRDFREMIGTLHVAYAYDGNYPKDPQLAIMEFDEWKTKVETLVKELQTKILKAPKGLGYRDEPDPADDR